VRSDFNFSLDDERVLNAEVVVNDSDNIKQDMSIDVYGRQKEEEIQDEISQLYSA
jgi:phosphatidylinositol glycan class S